MKYLEAYLRALKDFTIFFGVVFFIWSLVFEPSGFANYLIYLAISGSLAGPISALVQRKTDE